MSDTKKSLNFIEEIIEEDNRTGKWDGRVCTRFPPEPNGYLHIGHATTICLNFGLAERYGGKCNLRFDDTNPVKEEQEYIDSIIKDVRWLGGQGEVLYASDYFQQVYDWAVELIKKGKAYVDDLSPDDIREYRGTLTTPGRNSPFRERGAEENLDLFERMRKGEFADGAKVLRAKIDMASPNFNMRDPVMYRILHASHHRTGEAWCIYPMYDWAHGQEDAIEGVTHSICTLEFENHRPLYDWFIGAINDGRTDDGSGPWGRVIPHPQQIEFARVNLNYTVMSKRKLLQLVQEGHVSGWDDPRMPTTACLRRRGYTPEAIRDFCQRVGVSKAEGVADVALLEHCLREHLNKVAPRVMGVLRPLKVTIDNYPEGQVEQMDAINNPEDESAGVRQVPFSKTIYIEQTDFMEDPPRKFFRLGPGREVRLRCAYWVKCTDVIKNEAGEVIELRCTYDPETRGGNNPPDGRKVKGTIHWVSAAHAISAEVRLYDHLFATRNPDASETRPSGSDPTNADCGLQNTENVGWAPPTKSRGGLVGGAHPTSDPNHEIAKRSGDPPVAERTTDHVPTFIDNLNPNSLEVLTNCKLEPSLAAVGVPLATGLPAQIQFERHGYFCPDPDSTPDKLVFNRTVTLRDTWAKIAKKT